MLYNSSKLEEIKEEEPQTDRSLDEEIHTKQLKEEIVIDQKAIKEKEAFQHQSNKYKLLQKGQDQIDKLMNLDIENQFTESINVNPGEDDPKLDLENDKLNEIARLKLEVHDKLSKSCLNKYITDIIDVFDSNFNS